MKPLSLILSFLPLIAFSLLASVLPTGDIGVAGLIATLCAAAAIAEGRPVWPRRSSAPVRWCCSPWPP